MPPLASPPCSCPRVGGGAGGAGSVCLPGPQRLDLTTRAATHLPRPQSESTMAEKGRVNVYARCRPPLPRYAPQTAVTRGGHMQSFSIHPLRAAGVRGWDGIRPCVCTHTIVCCVTTAHPGRPLHSRTRIVHPRTSTHDAFLPTEERTGGLGEGINNRPLCDTHERGAPEDGRAPQRASINGDEGRVP